MVAVCFRNYVAETCDYQLRNLPGWATLIWTQDVERLSRGGMVGLFMNERERCMTPRAGFA